MLPRLPTPVIGVVVAVVVVVAIVVFPPASNFK